MSADENKALFRRFAEEVFNRRNLAAVDDYLAPSIVDHGRGNPSGDREGARQFIGMFLEALPDVQVVVEDLVAEGDKVVARLTCSGTHQGQLMGLAPTGKPVAVTLIEIIRYADGKMVEHWQEMDHLGMLQQLGVVPPMA